MAPKDKAKVGQRGGASLHGRTCSATCGDARRLCPQKKRPAGPAYATDAASLSAFGVQARAAGVWGGGAQRTAFAAAAAPTRHATPPPPSLTQAAGQLVRTPLGLVAAVLGVRALPAGGPAALWVRYDTGLEAPLDASTRRVTRTRGGAGSRLLTRAPASTLLHSVQPCSEVESLQRQVAGGQQEAKELAVKWCVCACMVGRCWHMAHTHTPRRQPRPCRQAYEEGQARVRAQAQRKKRSKPKPPPEGEPA